MFTNTTFEFDGQKSTDYGLLLVNLDTSMARKSFGFSKTVVEEVVGNKATPYFFGVNKEPLQFQITLAKQEEWNYDMKKGIVQWLFKDEYKPFVSTDNINLIYNCMAVDSPEKILIGNLPRMISLNFQCDAPWAWSPYYVYNYDLSSNSMTKIITIENNSNVEEYVYPEIWIKAINGGTISLKNTSDKNNTTTLINLLANETIYLNNEFKQIDTDVPSILRLKDFNRKWLKLKYGTNYIEITGQCLITSKIKYGIAV